MTHTAFTHGSSFVLKQGMVRGTRWRAAIVAGLVMMSLVLPVGDMKGIMAASGHRQTKAVGQVHVHIQGHITVLAYNQISVRDRRNVIHKVILTSATTYWHKLDQVNYSALKIGMRVYVLGLPSKSGIITALKIHIYDTKPKKSSSTATS